MKKTTIVFPIQGNQVILGMKKRGFGVGKWNGFGGKLEGDETYAQNAIRELHEETGIILGEEQLTLKAIIEFHTQNSRDNTTTPTVISHIFVARYDSVAQETEEMKPQLFDIDELPLDAMFEGDVVWIQQVLDLSIQNPLYLIVYYDEKSKLLGFKDIT